MVGKVRGDKGSAHRYKGQWPFVYMWPQEMNEQENNDHIREVNGIGDLAYPCYYIAM